MAKASVLCAQRNRALPAMALTALAGPRETARLYAAGSRTHMSLPLMQRASDRSLPVTTHLAAAGVVSTAVLGY